ncbi:hypothetical protein [Chroococcidiopsis sp.]|uniref:hypothetical protein n=1 Tax=Chroococcidiopsis sp. TaxID=3088168 RepID=UPI003F3981BC
MKLSTFKNFHYGNLFISSALAAGFFSKIPDLTLLCWFVFLLGIIGIIGAVIMDIARIKAEDPQSDAPKLSMMLGALGVFLWIVIFVVGLFSFNI